MKRGGAKKKNQYKQHCGYISEGEPGREAFTDQTPPSMAGEDCPEMIALTYKMTWA